MWPMANISASGAVEVAATLVCAQARAVHPTIKLDYPDPACDLDYVSEGSRALPAGYILKNSFAFGGARMRPWCSSRRPLHVEQQDHRHHRGFTIPAMQGQITLDRVSFGYRADELQVRDLCFSFAESGLGGSGGAQRLRQEHGDQVDSALLRPGFR